MPGVLAVTQLFFETNGFEVHTAQHAKEAIELYKTLEKAYRTPQVAIIDAAIGDGDDGFTLSADLAKLDKQKQTTMFIYTAYNKERAKLLAIGSGAESIIDKMKVGDALIAEIDAGLRNKARRLMGSPVKANGQFGGWLFSDREMGAIVINIVILLLLVWFVARLDGTITVLRDDISLLTGRMVANEKSIGRIQGKADAESEKK